VLQAERVLRMARAANPGIDSAVRTHSEEELQFMRRHEVGLALMGEQELAAGLARYALDTFGQPRARNLDDRFRLALLRPAHFRPAHFRPAQAGTAPAFAGALRASMAGGISLYMTGVTRRASSVEEIRPPMITQAIGE